MLSIRSIEKPEIWESFLKLQPYTIFVQSAYYGDFYRALGESSWILGVFEDETLVGGALVVSVHAKRGNFLFVPYGPIVPENQKGEVLRVWVDGVTALARKTGYNFVRVSPFLEATTEHHELFTSLGFRDAPMHMLAETTWMLDLRPSEEELLAAMNKNHRNLIRRCLNSGIRVERTSDASCLPLFHKILDTTTKRHQFHRFSEPYINAEFNAFTKAGDAAIVSAYLPDGRLDASAIIISHGDMACYRHGASYGFDKRLPTSYAVQWNAILQAKREGKVWYNFWGIAPQNATVRHPFWGITHFKRGFGGVQKDLLHCLDLPLTPKYYLNWLVESARRVRRGF